MHYFTILKKAAGVDTSNFAKKTHFANLKSDLDKLVINKFKNVPSNLSNLKSRVDKKADYETIIRKFRK